MLYLLFCTDGQCCYLYGSVPRNDSNCVPENGQFTLQYIVYNPHDPFTDLTVRWFRSMDVTRATLSMEVIATNIPGEYDLARFYSSLAVNTNCTHGSLYKDFFALIIHNFTTDSDGYYWCQIVINDSYLQPSQYAWFYAADRSSCTQELHLITASGSEIQCAENYSSTNTNTCPVTSTGTSTIVIAPSTATTYYSTFTSAASASRMIAPSISVTNTSTTTLVPTVTTVVLRMSESVIYVAGFFSVLILLLAALVVIVILLLHVHKTRRKKKGELKDILM